MIASRFKEDHQNQLLGRRRVLYLSDPLSWSTIASVVRSEVVVLCAVYAGAASCQADELHHLFSTPNIIIASGSNCYILGVHSIAILYFPRICTL
jgi:hypothetical protein